MNKESLEIANDILKTIEELKKIVASFENVKPTFNKRYIANAGSATFAVQNDFDVIHLCPGLKQRVDDIFSDTEERLVLSIRREIAILSKQFDELQ